MAIFEYNSITEYYIEFDIAVAGINTLLLIYESFQMSVGARGYCSSIWNFIDVLRILFKYLYTTIDLFYMYEIYQNGEVYILALFGVMILMLLRGFHYFSASAERGALLRFSSKLLKTQQIF